MIGKGLLIVISGPSGAGKGTICRELLKNNPQIRISFLLDELDARTIVFISPPTTC